MIAIRLSRFEKDTVDVLLNQEADDMQVNDSGKSLGGQGYHRQPRTWGMKSDRWSPCRCCCKYESRHNSSILSVSILSFIIRRLVKKSIEEASQPRSMIDIRADALSTTRSQTFPLLKGCVRATRAVTRMRRRMALLSFDLRACSMHLEARTGLSWPGMRGVCLCNKLLSLRLIAGLNVELSSQRYGDLKVWLSGPRRIAARQQGTVT
ncbi:hypothetical protein BDZ85DRAFT_270291 [Elsinoe ampelina]|uniref:Uncharacterized protein n=1 Tax=Elsinoe ampelina TaxID=302913 RepID=A0A6A6FYK1_9PEZI|nr:hypothetical protein BDZ85DRAFT_270291 [Elsinoe ampelina]